MYGERVSEEEFVNMQGWDDELKNSVAVGHIVSDNIIALVSYEFVRLVLAFGRKLGIDILSETFWVRK